MECFGFRHVLPFVVYQADRLTPEQYDVVAHDYQQRLEHLFDESDPYRSQNGGHYDEQQVLKPEFGLIKADCAYISPI